MKKILVGAFAAAFLFAAPAYAQSNEDMVRALDAQIGGSSAGASPAVLAAAVSALITNDPDQSTGAVTALTSAAVGQNASAAADVAGAAAFARPGDAAEIAAAASAPAVAAGGTTTDVGAIVAYAAMAASAAGVPTSSADIAKVVASLTGMDVADIKAAADDTCVPPVHGQEWYQHLACKVADVEDDGFDDGFVDENPAQDASPS
jgi:hypothetical protein